MRRNEKRHRFLAILAAAAFLLTAAGGLYAQDYRPLPDPVLALNGTEAIEGTTRVRYHMKVTNWASYPDGMFVQRPDLDPCGINDSASRTWIEIFDASDDSRIYGFCALGSGNSLNLIWFGGESATPPSAVYITLVDRDPSYGATYTSNAINVYSPAAPVAGSDSFSTNEDTLGSVNLMANDTDINGDPLVVSGIPTPPAHGTATIHPGGIIEYVPDANYNGPDNFQYTLNDGTYTTTGFAGVTVNSVVDAPNPPSVILTDAAVNPNNVSRYTPLFSWTFSDNDQADYPTGDWQTAYEIRIGPSAGSSTAWDSGQLSSLAPSGSFDGPELTPNTTYHWSVRVWDRSNVPGSYSADGTFVILDIGLRVFDGTSTIRVATDYVDPSYPLRISKDGTTYGIILVDPSDLSASKVRIQGPAGTKALKRM